MELLETQTERLSLRRWRDEDRPAFAAMNADPEVMRYFPKRLSRAESDAFMDRILAEMDECGWGLYAVERLEDGAMIGMVGLHRFDFGDIASGVEVGWRLNRRYWGMGYASEAAVACLDMAGMLGMERVYSFTAEINVPSRRVMERIGMEYAGQFEHPALTADDPLCRHVLYRKEFCRQIL